MARIFFVRPSSAAAARRVHRALPRTGLPSAARVRRQQRRLELAEQKATKRFNSLSQTASSLGQTQDGICSRAYKQAWGRVDFYGRLVDRLNARWNELESLLAPPTPLE